METLAVTSAYLFLGCIGYVMLSSFALRFMVDDESVKKIGARALRSALPPREVLTPVGKKIWMSRWVVLAAGLVFMALAYNLRPKEPNQPQQQRP